MLYAVSSRTLFMDLSPLRESRDFRLLWLSQAPTTFGRQVVIVAVSYQVYVLTHSSLAVGLLGVFQAVPIVVTGLYGGALADRYDRRRIQLVGKTVVAACSLTLALSAIGLRTPLALIYGVVAVSAAASTMDQAARSANVPRLVTGALLPSAMTLTQSVLQAAAIVGPALSGFVVAGVGVSGAYLLDVCGYLPAVALIWRMSPQPPIGAHEAVSSWRAALEGLTFVRRQRLLIGLFAADLVAMIFGMPTAVFPALALTVFGVGARGLGLLYAAPAVGALLGSLLSGWVGRVNRQGVAVLWAIAGWGAAITCFGLAGGRLWLGLPLLAVAGAADMVSAVFRSTILQLSVPDFMRGRMNAFHIMVVASGPRLGDLEAGLVAAVAGPVFSVVTGGLACLVGIGVLAALLPEIRRQRSPVAPSNTILRAPQDDPESP